jgi:hypothetical protein
MPRYARIPALAVVALAVLAVLSGAQPPVDTRALAPAGPRPPPGAGGPAVTFHSDRSFDSIAVPVRIRIPALHVDSSVQRLGLRKDGTIAVPARTDVAGWYEHGPRPGQAGPAVILGHVDSKEGPGIFIGLSKVAIGTTVVVDRADGTSATFRITKLAKVPKVQFPTDLVYAPTLDPTLRLVTCGGSFDRSRGSYRDNVIAFAAQV